jgi:GNAT superfamily N-acetyltransferase
MGAGGPSAAAPGSGGADAGGPRVRIARDGDLPTIAALRAQWTPDAEPDPDFEAHLAEWLAAEGDRRTVWLAFAGDEAIGIASVFEYRRMPRPGRVASSWGYVSNMFVREDSRDRGVGSALLAAIVDVARERGYARLVLSPALRAIPFYERAGFIVPDERAGESDRLMVRPLT